MDKYSQDIRVILNSKKGRPSQIAGQLEKYVDERHLKFALLEIIIPNNIKLVNVEEDTIKIEKRRISPRERETEHGTEPRRVKRSIFQYEPRVDLRNYFTWVVTYLKHYNMENDQNRMVREANASTEWREATAIFGARKAELYRGILLHFIERINESTAPPRSGQMDKTYELLRGIPPATLTEFGFLAVANVHRDVYTRFEDVVKTRGIYSGRLFAVTKNIVNRWSKIYHGIFENDLVRFARLLPGMTPSRLMSLLDPLVKAFHEYIVEERTNGSRNVTDNRILAIIEEEGDEEELRIEPTTVGYGNPHDTGPATDSEITSVSVINIPVREEPRDEEEPATIGYGASDNGSRLSDDGFTTVKVQNLPASGTESERGETGGADRESNPEPTSSTETYRVRLSELNFRDPLNAIAEVFPNKLKLIREKFGLMTKFYYFRLSHKVKFSISADETVILGGKMSRILSLPQRMQGPGPFESEYCVDPWIDYRILMVYSDITRPISLGEGEHPVVQVMPLLTKSTDKSFHYVFDNPLYLDLNKNHIRNINLSVHNEVGEPIELLSEARITLKLIIKKT